MAACLQNPNNVHLLKLYESGLPAWAVVLPSYGLWYRPWLRRVVSASYSLQQLTLRTVFAQPKPEQLMCV